ncbi:MAG: ATP-binding protein [Anaerolineae bacterium]
MFSREDAYISIEFVAQVLREMSHAAAYKAHNPLEQLVMVEKLLHEREMPRSSEARRFALYEVFSRIIENGLRYHRALYDLPMPAAHWTLDHVGESAAKDVGLERPNAELMVYSLLYHCFVRVDWAVTPEQFATWIAVGERTFRRYQTYALRRLTYTLIAEERAARRVERQRWLRLQLPTQSNRRLVGRDTLVASFSAIEFPYSLLITGISGIGKSAFAHLLIDCWIESDALSDAIWIEKPLHVEEVRSRLHERLIPAEVKSELRDALSWAEKPVVIILDACEKLMQDEANALERLLEECSAAQWVLTSQLYQPLLAVKRHLPMPPMDYDAALILLRQYRALDSEDSLFEEEAAQLYEQVGGIPDALISAVRYLEVTSWQQVSAALWERLYRHIFDRIKKNARIAWCLLAILPPVQQELPSDTPVWADLLLEPAVMPLRQWSVISRQLPFSLENGARRFIEGAVANNDSEITSYLEALLLHIDQWVGRDPSAVVSAVQHLLAASWLPLEAQRRMRWIVGCAPVGVRRGYTAAWIGILEDVWRQAAQTELTILYGVCLRQLGDWTRAENVFQEVITASGAAGAFANQSLALIELAVTVRYRGAYEEANDALLHASRSAAVHAPDLLPRVAIEQARIALDRKQADQAFQLLTGHPETVEVILLKCEAYLQFNFNGECRSLAERLLSRRDLDTRQRAAVHTIIGRSYEQDAQYESAHWHFATSVSLAEWGGDRLTQVRARANVGAALLHMEQFEKAQGVLLAAEREMMQLGDPVGAAAIRHNLHLIDMRLAR